MHVIGISLGQVMDFQQMIDEIFVFYSILYFFCHKII